MNKLLLNRKFSTTRLLVAEKPMIENISNEKVKTSILLENNDETKEGGLRTKNNFKKSYDKKPLITVVTVVYNGEKDLGQTIQSVINQSYDNVEYIIVDGGSSDKTVDIIKQYEDQIDYWVSEKDSGIYDAMNKATSLATGEWINFMNAGDKFHSAMTIKTLFEQISPKDIDILYGDVVNVYSSSYRVNRISKKIELFYQGLPFSHQSAFVKTKLLKEKPFNLRYKICADYDMFYKLYMEDKKFKYINNIIADCDMFGTSTNYFKSFKEKKIVSFSHEPNKNSYFSYRRYIILKIKNGIKSLLPFETVVKIRIFLSKLRRR
jgi:glycosyltransferase involved in cell wall biosynthesis